MKDYYLVKHDYVGRMVMYFVKLDGDRIVTHDYIKQFKKGEEIPKTYEGLKVLTHEEFVSMVDFEK